MRSSGIRLTMIVTCEVRFRMRVARPRARGRQRLNVLASYEVEHLAHLVGGQPPVAEDRPGARSLVGLDASHQRLPARSWPAWNLNVRVGANSPSLWPTIDSVTYTGMCLRPSWTARVWPTMSGMIVDRRDQVLMTFLSPLAFRASTFFNRWSSTKGPFLRLRGIGAVPFDFPSGEHRGCGVGGRSWRWTSCCGRGGGPRAGPRARPDGGRRSSCPRRRPAGGRRGSWPHRESVAACPSSGYGRPCPA